MESSDLLNCAIRVKQESSHVSFVENDSEMIDEKPDLKNFQLLSFSPENSNHTLQKCEENHGSKLDDKVEIVVECEDDKPNIRPLALPKIDDYSENNLQDLKDNNSYKIQSIIKTEAPGEVKKEIVCSIAEESNLKLECELIGGDKKNRNTKKADDQHKLKAQIYTMHSSSIQRCKTCGKIFKRKDHLKYHIDAVHNDITHTCDTCGKKFKHKTSLKNHIDHFHNGITHMCDTCGKKLKCKSYLKVHIDVMHNGVACTCDIFEKKFTTKGNLKIHVNNVHNRIRYACDVCEKIFSNNSDLKKHIDSIHRKLAPKCDICHKSFATNATLKVHIHTLHKGIIHN